MSIRKRLQQRFQFEMFKCLVISRTINKRVQSAFCPFPSFSAPPLLNLACYRVMYQNAIVFCIKKGIRKCDGLTETPPFTSIRIENGDALFVTRRSSLLKCIYRSNRGFGHHFRSRSSGCQEPNHKSVSSFATIAYSSNFKIQRSIRLETRPLNNDRDPIDIVRFKRRAIVNVN
jgi:hypothetical protein